MQNITSREINEYIKEHPSLFSYDVYGNIKDSIWIINLNSRFHEQARFTMCECGQIAFRPVYSLNFFCLSCPLAFTDR